MRVWHLSELGLLLDYVYLLKLTSVVVAERSTIKDECATVMVLAIAELTPMIRLGNRTYRPGKITKLTLMVHPENARRCAISNDACTFWGRLFSLLSCCY